MNATTNLKKKAKKERALEYLASQAQELNMGYEEAEGDNWISVEDRLPEIKTHVLAYLKRYDSPVIRMLGKDGGWYYSDGKSSSGWGGEEPITHSQPLPQPPKE